MGLGLGWGSVVLGTAKQGGEERGEYLIRVKVKVSVRVGLGGGVR